jgi:hypothetical protein
MFSKNDTARKCQMRKKMKLDKNHEQILCLNKNEIKCELNFCLIILQVRGPSDSAYSLADMHDLDPQYDCRWEISIYQTKLPAFMVKKINFTSEQMQQFLLNCVCDIYFLIRIVAGFNQFNKGRSNYHCYWWDWLQPLEIFYWTKTTYLCNIRRLHVQSN